jgi:hypothetical protein
MNVYPFGVTSAEAPNYPGLWLPRRRLPASSFFIPNVGRLPPVTVDVAALTPAASTPARRKACACFEERGFERVWVSVR